MKPSNVVVMIALAILGVACQRKTEIIQEDQDPKGTRWILEFNSKTKVRDEIAFERALNRTTNRWEQNVQIGDKPPRDNYSNIPVHPGYTPETRSYPKSEDGPGSLHVTQRVGLYKEEDLERITRQIKNP